MSLARSKSNSQAPGEEGFRKEPLRLGVPRWAQRRFLKQHNKQELDKGKQLAAKKPIPSGEKAAEKIGVTDDIDKLLREEDLLHELQALLPHEKPRPQFRTLLNWGRYAEIISYHQRKRLISLYSRKAPRAAHPPRCNRVSACGRGSGHPRLAPG